MELNDHTDGVTTHADQSIEEGLGLSQRLRSYGNLLIVEPMVLDGIIQSVCS